MVKEVVTSAKIIKEGTISALPNFNRIHTDLKNPQFKNENELLASSVSNTQLIIDEHFSNSRKRDVSPNLSVTPIPAYPQPVEFEKIKPIENFDRNETNA
jgi:hypothetical protein